MRSAVNRKVAGSNPARCEDFSDFTIFCMFIFLQIDPESVNMNHAYIQITHAEPHFTEDTLEERPSVFERQNKLSSFVFETPFTKDGRQQGDVARQCMRKTVLTSKSGLLY